MNQKQSYSIYEHRLPKYFFRFPSLIRPVHWGHQLLHNRNRIVLRKLKKWMKDSGKSLKVLDAGCGEGNYLIPLAHTFPLSIFFGLDYNAQLVEFVNHYSKCNNLNIAVDQADLNAFEIDGKFDAILCVAVLQMLKDDVSFLKQLRKSMNPEGLLVINVPISHQPILPVRSTQRSMYNKVHGGIARKYTIESLNELLDKAGFKIVQKNPTNGFWGTLGNELLNIGIDALQKGGILKRAIFAVLFAVPLLPAILVCNLLNAVSVKKRVSGMVVFAQLKSKIQ